MKTIFTYVTLLLVSASSFAEISSTEKNALVKFNKATKGSQWINKWRSEERRVGKECA
jgi:hypothetical protein